MQQIVDKIVSILNFNSNMILKKNKLVYIIWIALGIILFVQCKKEDEQPPEDIPLEIRARDDFHLLMKEWYLWYDKMPEVDIEDYNTPEELLEALRYDSLDKWSYITSLESFNSYFEEGEYEGHGFGYTYDEDGKVWLTFVFNASDFISQGVKRGWRLLKINGKDIIPFTDLATYFNGSTAGTVDYFEFQKPDLIKVEVSSTRKTIKMNTVLLADTIHVADQVVGHLVFKSFIGPSNAELDSVFNFFNSVGAQQLILDLRYNGGGRMDVTAKLASLIAGPSTDGQAFIKYVHNDMRTPYDDNIYFVNEANALSLNQVIVISSRGTASASEAIINGLKPYINVVVIGDNSYGKPVGMHTWDYADTYAFVPISFELLNANNVGGYYDGLPADSYIEDGLAWDFPDRNEYRLKEAIYYLKTGGFTGSSGSLKSLDLFSKPVKRGLKWEIGAE